MPNTQIMGILNCTPDSFSGDGLSTESHFVAKACALARRFVREGADLLDIGGESTRPGAQPVSFEEELRRVVPVIKAIHEEFPHIPISCDTTKRIVAEESVKVGASIINDISALEADPSMIQFLKSSSVLVILMHNRASYGYQTDPKYGAEYRMEPKDSPVLDRVKRDLTQSLLRAHREGISEDRILLDPGIGFGKSVAENCTLLNHIADLKALGRPLVIGPSRKSFIGHILDCQVDDRLEGTAATVAVSAIGGADIIRVHDVKFMKRLVLMIEAIKGIS